MQHKYIDNIQKTQKQKPTQAQMHQQYSPQQSASDSSEQCIFCPQSQSEPVSDLFTMMNQALAAKHLSQSNNHAIFPIDIILKIEEPTTSAELEDYIVYKEMVFVDNVEENMKRQYRREEFTGKINMLSQYYKFHKDIPHIVERGIEKILAKYYDRRRQYDYKCIKKQLKEEQGLSITSVEDSATENSQTVEQRSRYSTLLDILNETNQKDKKEIMMSDSNVLEEICKEIGRALPKTKILDTDIKGSFYENDRNFQIYVKNQRMKKQNKTIKSSAIQQHLKRKGLFHPRPKDNYFNFDKNKNNFQHNQTIKNRNEPKLRNKRYDKQRQRTEKHDQNKKKFIYNTNIKIQIQNAMFYPHQNSNNYPQFGSGPKSYEVYTSNNIASRKSILGKINTIAEDRYRTPVSKIYQPQQTDNSTRYRRSRNSSVKKERIKTRQSKEIKDIIYEQRERERDIGLQKRVMSSYNLKKSIQTTSNQNNFKQRPLRHGTISVAKLKLENQRNDIRSRGNSIKRGSSSQNLRKRSITVSQNKLPYEKIIPIAKYSSSQFKDNKFKGVSINDLLHKKLNIHQR